MDKRILKTKKALKTSLVGLLREKDFDTITTTEICGRAMVSRNTFYNYYEDKYALLADCFTEYEKLFQKNFGERQEKNNPACEIRQGFINLIDTFLDTESVYKSIPILSSFDLMELYYRSLVNILKKYEHIYAGYVNPAYDLNQFHSFLILGFWGFVHENPRMDREVVREKAHRLMLDLLKSPLFRLTEEEKQI